MNIRATRRFGLKGIFLSSALVVFSGAAPAAEIEICTPSGSPALMCGLDLSGSPVTAVVGGGIASWDAVFENGQFLQLSANTVSLTLGLGFDVTNDNFWDAGLDVVLEDFILTDEIGNEISAGLTAGAVTFGGVDDNQVLRTWTGAGLSGLAIYDFHISCSGDDCVDFAGQVNLISYNFEAVTDPEVDAFTIGPLATVPAPASLALLGLGLLALGAATRRTPAV